MTLEEIKAIREAEKQAEEMRIEAQRKADQIVREARNKAETTVTEAVKEGNKKGGVDQTSRRPTV